MAKMGRPIIGEKKEKSISVRFSINEFQKMSEYAKAHGITITQLVQMGVQKVMNE